MQVKRFYLLAVMLYLVISLSSCAIKYRGWYKDYGINSKEELESPSSVPKLIEALQAKDSNIRERAFESLGRIRPGAKVAVPALINALFDSDSNVRERAIKSLGDIGPEAKDAVPALLKAFLDSDKDVREKASIAIGKIGYVDNVVLDSIKILAAHDPEPDVRTAASNALQKFSLQSIRQTTSKNEPSLVIDKKPKDELPRDSIHSVPNFYSIPRPNDVAIVIGIENYQIISQKSDYSYNDAELIKGYLKALGFQERNIMYLTNERASLSGLRKTFEVWLPNNIKENSKVFIYYSGHGAPDVKGNGYIVPYDGDPGYLEVTGYPIDKLYANLESLKAAEIMVVMDSCFSGAGGRSILPKGARPISLEVKNPILLSDKIAIISSSKMNQISTSYSEKSLGLFTYYFLTALKEGKMTLADIYSYIKPMVEDEARRMNVEQSPQLLPGSSLPSDKFSLR